MAYQLYASNGGVTLAWVPDGAGPMSMPSAQKITAAGYPGSNFQSPLVVTVPGGDSPTTGNITTACNSLATALATYFNASIGQIQGWSTGGN